MSGVHFDGQDLPVPMLANVEMAVFQRQFRPTGLRERLSTLFRTGRWVRLKIETQAEYDARLKAFVTDIGMKLSAGIEGRVLDRTDRMGY